MLETWETPQRAREPHPVQFRGMGRLCGHPGEEASSKPSDRIRKSRVLLSGGPVGKPLKHTFQIVGTH